VIAGVCGGLGRYLGIDPVLLRIAAVLLVFAGGAGLVLYLVGWIAMPEEPETIPEEPTAQTGEAETQVSAPPPAESERTRGAVVLGLVFVVLGAFFLVDEIWPDFLSWEYVWPLALIAIGVAILARARR
jgi:phage shock protein C